MINRRNRCIALLLSFMMVALNLFGSAGSLLSYAETDSENRPAAELTADNEQAEDTADAEEIATPAEEPEEVVAPIEDAEEEKEEAAPVEQAEEVKEEAAPVEQAQPEEDTEEIAEDIPEEKEVAFSDEEKFEGVNIKVTADEGVFPEGAELEVRDLTEREEKKAEKAIDKIDGENADIAEEYLLDISVIKDGKEIEPDNSKGDVQVAFTTEEVADENLDVEVFHVADNGVAEELAVEVKGETAIVETDGFSTYSLRFINTAGTMEYDLVMGGEVWLSDILDAIGRSDQHYNIYNITSNSTIISTHYAEREHWVIDEWVAYNDYKVTAIGADTSGEHSLDVRFNNGTSIVIVIKTHAHSWNLRTEGGTAMLECTAVGCPHPQYTWTLTASNATYNGNPHYAVLDTPEGYKGDDVSVSSIAYYRHTASGREVADPINAGTYTAEVTIDPHNGTSTDAKTIYATFTIDKADITVTAPTAIPNLIYSRSWKNLHTEGSAKSATTSQGFTVLYAKGSDTAPTENYGTSVEQGFDAGTYNIWYWVEGDSNHNSTAPAKIQASIAKKSVVVSGIFGNNKVYDGTDAATVNTNGVTYNGKYSGDELSISATAKFKSDETQGLVGKDVGTNKEIELTLTFGGTDAKNYTLDTANSQKTARADISQKDIEVSWTNATALQYNGQLQAPTPHLLATETINNNDKKIYKIDEGKVRATVDVDSKQKNVGSGYKAYVGTLVGDEAGNYNLVNKTTPAEFSIIPKKLTAVWTETTQEYEAEGLKPTVTLGGFVNDEAELVKPIADTMTIEAVEPTELVEGKAYNAGSYVATVALEDAEGVASEDSVIGNYELTNPTSDFTITRAPLTVKASGWVYYGDTVRTNRDIKDLEYSGIEGLKGEDGAEVLTAIEEGTTVRFETNYNFTDDATDVNGARYYLIPEFEEAFNYTVTNEDGELTVYPKPVTLEWTHTHNKESEAVSGDQIFTYDAKLHTYTAEVTENSYVKVKGKKIDDEITITFTGNEQSESNVTTGTEKYTAYAAELSDPNYSLQEVIPGTNRTKRDVATRAVDFIINQRPVELKWAPSEFIYNGEDQRPEVSVDNLQTNDAGEKDAPFEVAFTVEKTSEDFPDGRGTSKDAGNYLAKAVNEESGYLKDKNYSLLATPADEMSEMVSSSKFGYTIKPLAIKVTWTTPAAWTYDAKEHTQEYTTNVVEGDEDYLGYVIEDGSTWTARNAGSYSIVATALTEGPEGDRTGNYTFAKVTRNWKINPRAVEIKWNPTATEYTYDAKDHTFTAKITNVQSDEKGEKDTVALKTSGTWSAKDAGSYTAKIDGLKNNEFGNYVIAKGTKVSHAWKIKQAPLTITAKAKTIKYGQDPANAGVTYSGFKGGETQAVLTGTLKFKYNYAKYGKPGTYKITPYGLSGKNYKITYKTGALTVKDVQNRLLAKGTASGTNAIVIKWNGVANAAKYDVCFASCGAAKIKKIASTKNKTYTVKNLAKNSYYRFYVEAFDSNGKKIASSFGGHVTTGNVSGKFTNIKSITASKKSVSLKKGKSTTITAKVTGVINGKTPTNSTHAAKARYMSSNNSVATVNSAGKITAKGPGFCRIYVVAANGDWTTVEVTVK